MAFTFLILPAILFPVFARAREAARKSTCMSNMKECAVALQMYWTDYDATLPSSAVVSHSETWNEGDFLTFATKAGNRPPASGEQPKTWSELLYSYMKAKDIVFCPSDPDARGGPDARASYWWKCAVDKAWYDPSIKARKEGDYAFNGEQVIFYEHMGWHSGDKDGLKNGVHINVAYMDSHIGSVTLQNATSGDPVNCAANSDGEPMYFNFDNKTEAGSDNPPPADVPAKYINPNRYSDRLQ